MLPTKAKPLADGITGASPKGDKSIQIYPGNLDRPFVVKAEFNHSVDFNDFYPKHAKEGDANYSGGKDGCGLPSEVYAATVYPDTKEAIIAFGKKSTLIH